MATALGFDAAFCPNPVPTEVGGQSIEFAEVYIGGSSAERRTGWSISELDRVAHLAKLPIWVPTPGIDNPSQAASGCLSALRAFRVPAFASPWRAVLIDLETGAAAGAADPSWLAAFRSRLEAGGYDTMPYASVSSVCGYPSYLGRLGACWDGSQDLARCNGELIPCSLAGKQYLAEVSVRGGFVDLDVLDAAMLPHLGQFDGPRVAAVELVAETAPRLIGMHVAPAPAPAVTPAPPMAPEPPTGPLTAELPFPKP